MKTIDSVLTDPASSNWLKAVLQSALLRDPVDAANDANILAELLDQNARTVAVSHLIKIVSTDNSRS